MLSVKQMNENDIDLCYELDSQTISLWSKKQWEKSNAWKKNSKGNWQLVKQVS